MLKIILSRVRSFQLSILIVVVFIGFFASSLWILYSLGTASMEKARAIRTEFVDRDLRELVGRFDADERYVLEHNIKQLTTELRDLTPLLLPRQYYVGLPPNYLRVSPRQPPRNCFVALVPIANPQNRDISQIDKVCPYFAENEALGKYLFLDADLIDASVVTLTPGDLSLTADALKILVVRGDKSATWWLTFQVPRSGSTRGRYEINAIRENSNGTLERDKRVEGWAYVQHQVDGTQRLHIIARIDFKEFAPELESQSENWPPKNWQTTQVRFARKDVNDNQESGHLITYDATGVAQLSISDLAKPIFESHASLFVSSTSDSGGEEQWKIQSTLSKKDQWHYKNSFIRVVDGDLLIANDELVRSQILPDTTLKFVVTHPGTIIERGIWQTLLNLAFVFITGLIFAFYFSRNLLLPIFKLTRQIRHLVAQPNINDQVLPYSNQNNELGTLAKGFNDLLFETRARMRREHQEELARKAAEERRRSEEIRIREANLNVIGHEIRSPLQALMSLNKPGTIGRHYIDRILAALPHLQGSLRPEDAVSSRTLSLEKIDLALFLNAIVSNVQLEQIHNVLYRGPDTGVICLVDDGAIEDCIDNILTNADRFRKPGTPIVVVLEVSDSTAAISISNEGPQVDETDRDRIFDYGFTTTPNQDGSARGFGLFVARQYISGMQGNIGVANIDSGVVFTIKIPLFLKDPAGSESSNLNYR